MADLLRKIGLRCTSAIWDIEKRPVKSLSRRWG